MQLSKSPNESGTPRRRAIRGNTGNELQYKRSFFVRMVSDPKIYNPKIVAKSRALTGGDPLNEVTTAGEDQKDTTGSWISWPLGLLLQGVFDDHSTARLRFRNWDTKVTLKPPTNHYGGGRNRSKSPPNDIGSTGSSRSQSPEKY